MIPLPIELLPVLKRDIRNRISPAMSVVQLGLYRIDVAPELAIALQVAAARGKVPQATVAREMGMTKQAYQRLEDPKANLSVKMLKRIAESMGKRLEVQFV